jgi:hypothetical protein
MNLDDFIKKDGNVSSLLKHEAIWVGIGIGIAVVVKLISALIFPVAIVGGAYMGYRTYQADKRINGDSNDA